MALTATQKVTVAEITRETYATIDSLAGSLNAEQEAFIVADIATWNTNRNKLKIELKGEVNFRTTPLLGEIRRRVRKTLGLPLYSTEEHGTSESLRTKMIF